MLLGHVPDAVDPAGLTLGIGKVTIIVITAVKPGKRKNLMDAFPAFLFIALIVITRILFYKLDDIETRIIQLQKEREK